GFDGPLAWRRAEPCVAQRAATVDTREDWLPEIAVAHSITSYPVGPRGPYPHSAYMPARKPRGWDPSTTAAVCVAQGWHGHHPSRARRGAGACSGFPYALLSTAPSGMSPVVR